MLRAATILHPNPALDLQFALAELGFHERYSHDSGATFSDTTLWTPVFHAGAAAHVRPNLTARVSLGTGAAAPPAAALNTNPADLFAQTPVGAAPYTISQRTAPDLTLETSFGYDAGVEYRLHGDTTTLSADIYHTIVHGAFVDGSATGAPLQYTWFNAPPMTHEGAELSLQQFKRVGLGFIAQAAFVRTYVNETSSALYAGPFGAFTANLGIVPGQNLSGGSLLVPGANDVAQTRVPYAQGYTEISYKWPRGSRLSVGALYYGANNPYARPAFATLNSNLELSVGALSKFQLSVENLTNAYGGSLPLGYAGTPIALANGTTAPVNAGILTPFTVRVLFRQSIGPGAIFER
jgi:TonB dependent receptor